MIHSTDQIGRKVTLRETPKRIVSLVPSITESLFHLELDHEVVGITKFCHEPAHWFREKTRIGGTKTFHIEKIEALKPDLILANKEENDAELVKALMEKFPVWVSDVKNEIDALDLLKQLGKLTNRSLVAEKYCADIEQNIAEFGGLKKEVLKVAYMIWQEPIMVAGGDTFINSMLQLCGWKNAFSDQNRYPKVTAEDLQKANLDVILLSSEPFPFAEKHIEFFQNICPEAVIRLIDGTYFSWYGTRLLPAIKYFANLNVR